MYVKLAKSNAKKSIKDYLIYFITITICVSLFYAITSLSSSNCELITEKTYNFEILQLILKYATYTITAILILLIAYVDKYMIRRRQREFAIYILLGVEQKGVALMFFIETLLIGILAVVAGIFIGNLFSQVIIAIVLMSAKQEVVFNFKLYIDTVVITFTFFISMFCIIGLYNFRVLRKIKLINMLNAQKQVEFQFKRSGKVYGAIFILAIILYTICGYYTYKLINTEVDYSVESVLSIGISFVAFIIGTYALFYSISYIMVHIKNKCINFKYEGTNLFLIGSIVSKIKTAPILMATIATTFLGAMISFIITIVMAQWAQGYLDMRITSDIDIRNYYNYQFGEYRGLNDINDIPKLDYSEIITYLDDKGYGVEDYCQLEKYFINDDDFNKYNIGEVPTLAIRLSDFNKLRSMQGEESIELSDNEFTTQWHGLIKKEQIDEYIKEHSQLNVHEEVFNLSENAYYQDDLGEGIYNYYADNIMILPDEACDNLTLAETNFLADVNNEMSAEEANEFEINCVDKWFAKNNSELINKYNKDINFQYRIISTRIKSYETNNILNITLAMRILGIYLGVVLLMISLTVLSLSQLVDSVEHKDRFNTLRRLGVKEKEIKGIILKQISVYFVIPMMIAMIGVIIFIYNFYLIYKEVITVYIGDTAFILSIIFGISLMIVLYLCYFIGTYYTFNRNVKN